MSSIDDFLTVTPRQIEDVTNWLSNVDVKDLPLGEQLLMLSAQAEMVKKILPIMENHKEDLVKYRITQVKHRK